MQTSYFDLLLGYAAGHLDEAQNLIVASHLTYSPKARNYVDQCESIGGMLIENECSPETLCGSALENVLSKIDAVETPHERGYASAPCAKHLGFKIPKPLHSSLRHTEENMEWRSLFPGMKAHDIALTCQNSKARFMQASPGTKSPHHGHHGLEITLVLDGAFEDETGQYKVGDLVVTDESFDHTPLACPDMGCTCLVVSTAPIKLTGIASLLNPFLKT